MIDGEINQAGDEVSTPYPSRTSRRSFPPSIAAEIEAAARRTVAAAPPPTQAQLSLLARLCAAHPIQPAEQVRKSA